MKSGSSAKDKRHNSVIYTILLSIIIVAIGMSIFHLRYIYPSFVNQIVENTENQAVRVGRHLTREVLEHYSEEQFLVSQELKMLIDNSSEDYNLWKIKIFSYSGETIYSTSKEDIGSINKKSYFHDIVAEGNTYTQVIEKNSKSLEGQIVTSDVVEAYIPIMSEGRFIGAFELYYNITTQKESLDNLIDYYNYILYTLTSIIIIVSLFLISIFHKNMKERQKYEEELLEMAHIDKLTGVYNRRMFLELLQKQIETFNCEQGNGCVMLIDIDYFKKVNDTYGHQVGDDVIFSVAQTCKAALRGDDIFARYGGEEFIAFLPKTDRQNAFKVAERVRQRIESTFVPYYNGTINVTISLGLVHFKEVDELSIDNVVNEADKALYSAKNGGRNKVCFRDYVQSGYDI